MLVTLVTNFLQNGEPRCIIIPENGWRRGRSPDEVPQSSRFARSSTVSDFLNGDVGMGSQSMSANCGNSLIERVTVRNVTRRITMHVENHAVTQKRG